MKTTVDIRDDLLRAVKERARQHGLSVRAVLERALERELVEMPAEPEPLRIRVFDARPRADFFERSWSEIRDEIYEERLAKAAGSFSHYDEEYPVSRSRAVLKVADAPDDADAAWYRADTDNDR